MTDNFKLRWFHPTPGRFLIALLVLEGSLLLSERFCWFGFNEHKGWTVLIAVGIVGVALVLMLLWFLVSLVFRWRFQFSIRSLFALTIAVAIPCSWLAVEMKKAREQKEAVERITNMGGGVRYARKADALGNGLPGSEPPAPAWLQDLLGVDFFTEVVQADFNSTGVTDAGLGPIEGLPQLRWLFLGGTRVTDAGLERIRMSTRLEGVDLDYTQVTDSGLRHIKGMTSLRWLGLRGNRVTDAGLEQLGGLTELESLGLNRTHVTDDGVKKFQQALPNCQIYR
jgi:hypothetical protein